MTPASQHFADRLLEAIERAGGPACVGVDPVYEKLPEQVRERSAGRVEAVERFSLDVIDAIAGVAPVVKLQSACFERFGSQGIAALERAAQRARDERLLVILDAKRADIAATSGHSAAWAFDEVGADAITLSPYMGADALEPYLDKRWSIDRGRGVFILARTSNPGAREIQSAQLADGGTVARRVARMIHELGEPRRSGNGMSDVGAVVAANAPDDAADLRSAMPHQFFLAPGFGAQGGSRATVASLFNEQGAGALITASRSVIYAYESSDAGWCDRVRLAAAALVEAARAAAQQARR